MSAGMKSPGGDVHKSDENSDHTISALLLLAPYSVSLAAESEKVESWSFDTEAADQLPKGFSIGTLFDRRPAGEWKVLKSAQAKSQPNLFAQVSGKGAEHAYKVVLVEKSMSSDLELDVSLFAVEGKADMGGGLIWRASDDRNYYLTRANPLAQNIRIYRVVNGVRHILKNFDHIIDVRQWHHLRVTMMWCQIKVSFDQKPIFDLCDKTFSGGNIGLWTKSDAVTYFDDLRLSIAR